MQERLIERVESVSHTPAKLRADYLTDEMNMMSTITFLWSNFDSMSVLPKYIIDEKPIRHLSVCCAS